MNYNNAKKIGYDGEKAVCDFLIRHEYAIIKRNFTIRGGEIDIIAMKNGVMAFVEVKTRKKDSLTSGEEAITPSKKKRIIKTAQAYIDKFDTEASFYRFDVAVVTMDNGKILKLTYYAGAFDASK